MASSSAIPSSVLPEILKRLPVKSLVRFITVSKSWYDLIIDPYFISMHMEHNSNISQYIVRQEVYCTFHRLSLKKFDETGLHEHMALEFSSGSTIDRLVGACKGLLCINDPITDGPYGFHVLEDRLSLLNPSIRRVMTLPFPNYAFKCRSPLIPMSAIGFGFDTLSDDFKIVRIVYSSIAVIEFESKVEVFSLKSMKWRSIEATPPPSSCIFGNGNTFLKGKIHWVVTQDTHAFIQVFDLSLEKFSTISLPDSLSTAPISFISITSMRDSLLLLENSTREFWVMKEYGDTKSWIKLLSNNTTSFIEIIYGRLDRAWFEDGRAILETDNGLLVSCIDGQAQQIQSGLISVNWGYYFERNVGNYTESLMLLNSYGFFKRNISNGCVELSLDFHGEEMQM